tara:strand:- start:251 stop:817 length:567 start_codon:yes stop_codon:yes gene_type:complete
MSDVNYDYSDVEIETSEADLARVHKLVELQAELETAVETATQTLADAKSKLRDVAEDELPAMMLACGLNSFETSSGITVGVMDKIRASISTGNAEAAHGWLEQNGFGKIIKHEIKISFAKGDDAWAKKFMRDCAQRKKPLVLVRKDQVHNQTLCAFAREQLKEGREFPEELFGVFRQRVAKIGTKDDK